MARHGVALIPMLKIPVCTSPTDKKLAEIFYKLKGCE